ncbi:MULTISPECIES: hypothetical protein [unclassified Bradyrhizobium]
MDTPCFVAFFEIGTGMMECPAEPGNDVRGNGDHDVREGVVGGARMNPTAVIARSEATKQSMSLYVVKWIASLRSQ